jgi:hypothetical protein
MKKIVVITSGWVVMGDVTEHEDRLTIDDASVIRVWGTTAGLGEIALNGPTTSTVLDPAGVVEVYTPAVVMQIPCTYDVR